MLLTVCASSELLYKAHRAFCGARFFSLFVLAKDAAEFSLPYPMEGILFLRPDLAPEAANAVAVLRKRYPEAKIITLAPEGWDTGAFSPDRTLFTFKNFQIHTLLTELLNLLPGGPHRSRTPGSIIVNGLYLDSSTGRSLLYGHPIHFTLQDTQLLLFLCARAPEKTDADAIARCCTVPGKEIVRTSVHVRISRVNAKVRRFTGRPLIALCPKEGYYIAH